MKLYPEILTHPNIPKPLHGVNPRSIKGKDWWDSERQKAYLSTNNHCISCGVHQSSAKFSKRLEAHEDYTIDYKNGVVKINKIIPLCHMFIHSGLLSMKLSSEDISPGKFKYILQHGCNILYNNGLEGFSYTVSLAKKNGCINIPEARINSEFGVAWSEWHLLFEGKKYYSNFKSF